MHVSRLEAIPDFDDKARLSLLALLPLALTHLAQREYQACALALFKFASSTLTNVSRIDGGGGGGGEEEGEWLPGSRIALYAVLCSLASFTNRRELRHYLAVDSAGGGFKSFLEQEPLAKDLIRNLSDPSLLSLLQRHQPEWSLDPNLRPHLDTLLEMIHDRLLIQATLPFTRISLTSLLHGFESYYRDGDPATILQQRLLGLIRKGKIHARLDTRAQALILVPAEQHNRLQALAEVQALKVCQVEMKATLCWIQLQ